MLPVDEVPDGSLVDLEHVLAELLVRGGHHCIVVVDVTSHSQWWSDSKLRFFVDGLGRLYGDDELGHVRSGQAVSVVGRHAFKEVREADFF